jgi:hypothetical protein
MTEKPNSFIELYEVIPTSKFLIYMCQVLFQYPIGLGRDHVIPIFTYHALIKLLIYVFSPPTLVKSVSF